MEVMDEKIAWYKNFLIHITYYPIKNFYGQHIDLNNNIIGVYAPHDFSPYRILEVLYPVITKLPNNPHKFQYRSEPVSSFSSFQYGNSTLYILGEKYTLEIKKASCNDMYVGKNTKMIRMYKKNKRYIELFKKFSIQQLTPIVNTYMKYYMQEMGLTNKSFTVKNMRGHAGCDCNKSISISTNLMFYPLEYIRMVVVHELCHFFVHDHGQKFYRTMEKFLPEWRSSTIAEYYYEGSELYMKIGPRYSNNTQQIILG